MERLDKLRELCEKKYEETNDERYTFINKILSEDDCFFIIDMDVAIDILISLGIDNPIEYYRNLISYEEMEKNKIRVVD